MIAMLAALVGATTAPCIPIAGADRLWSASTRWVIAGELHGTNETPDAFANLVCLAAATGRPVTVALEYPADGQAVIDAWLASDGDTAARSALLTLPIWSKESQDGRSSVAFLRLWNTLRVMKQSRTITGVVASDVGRSTPPGQTRDAAMAASWTAIPKNDRDLVLILVGNVHAMRKPAIFGDRKIITAGSLMPRRQTVSINVIGIGGTAWTCESDGCREHDSGPRRPAVAGITFDKNAERSWDATYQLGGGTTAAAPAITR